MTSNGVNDTEHEMYQRKGANPNHGSAKRWLDNAVSHAHDEEQEERERVTRRVKYGDYNEEDLGSRIRPIEVLIV
jgi:hypothetical protein